MPAFDTHMLLAVLCIAVGGGFIGLDRTAFGQFMISQPIVAAPLTGLLLGDAAAGLIIGATLELIWVLDMPIGTFVPADSTISAVSATAIAALGSPGGAPLPVIGVTILLTAVMAPLTMRADGLIRHWNSRFADAAEAEPERMLAASHLFGMATFFAKSVALYLLFLPSGIAVVTAFQRLPAGDLQRGLTLFVNLLPLLGAASVARKLSVKTADLFLLSGFVVAAVMAGAAHAPLAIVALLVAGGALFGARYRAQRS